MNILEALKAAREKGVRIKPVKSTVLYYFFNEFGILFEVREYFKPEYRHNPVHHWVNTLMISEIEADWEIVETPRVYMTFFEAFEKMRNGAKCRFEEEAGKTPATFFIEQNFDLIKGSLYCLETNRFAIMTSEMIDSKKWYEVKNEEA